MKNARAIVAGITTAREVELGASQGSPHLLRHLRQRLQALRHQPHLRCIAGRHGAGR